MRGIDSSNALLIINCNDGQYDKSIHRLLYKNRDSNNIISLLNKVLNLKLIRNPTNCGVSIGLKIPVKKEQHDFSCSS